MPSLYTRCTCIYYIHVGEIDERYSFIASSIGFTLVDTNWFGVDCSEQAIWGLDC